MLAALLRFYRQFTRILSVRVLMIAALAVLALVASMILGPWIPDWAVDMLGSGSLDTILEMLALSMLTVTTFSLTIMTGAIHFASANTTPRSRLVLRADTVTHTVLANFVGAFLFALIGIILRATPMMGPKQSVVLFAFAILVVAIVLASIIRWIHHLETLGSVDATIGAIESAACEAMELYARRPALGGHVLDPGDLARRSGGRAIACRRDGYVQQVLEELLQDQADEIDADLYLAVRPGSYVASGMPLAYLSDPSGLTDTVESTIRSAFVIDRTRSFDQDPLLGVTVLTEVASRALSEGINDPQTAVDVINRLSSVLMRADPQGHAAPEAPVHPRLWMVPASLDAFYRASFDVIARDGAGLDEIAAALDRALAALTARSGPEGAAAARACADRIADRNADGG